MPQDKNKAIKRALRFVKRGDIDNAITAYFSALDIDCNDTRVLMRLAALLMQRNDPERAVKYYLQAADQFTKRGFFERAIASYNQVLRIDGSREDIYKHISELYIRLNEPSQAVHFYSRLADLYEARGTTWPLIETLEKMASLAPHDSAIAARLSDLYFENDMANNGYEAIKPVIRRARESGDEKQYLALLERVAEVHPYGVENLMELAGFYREQNCRALAYRVLAGVCEMKPDDLDVIRMMADLAAEQEWPEQAVENLEKLKAIYEQKGFKHLTNKIAQEIAAIGDREKERHDGPQAAEQEETTPADGQPPDGDSEDEASSQDQLSAEEAEENAELYAKLNDTQRALQYYKQLVIDYESQGKISDALAAMEKMADLDSDNLVIKAKLSDLYFSSDMPEKGYRTIRPVIDNIRASGDRKHYFNILTRVASRVTDNLELLRELADHCLENDYRDQAYEALARIDRLQPADAPSLRQLSDFALKLEKKDQAVEYLERLTEAYEESGMEKLAKKTAKEILYLDPEHEEARAYIEDEVSIDVDHTIEEEEPQYDDRSEALVDKPQTPALPPNLDALDLIDYLKQAGMELRFKHGDNAFLVIRIELEGDGMEVRTSLDLKDPSVERAVPQRAILELEDTVRKLLEESRLGDTKDALENILSSKRSAKLKFTPRIPEADEQAAPSAPDRETITDLSDDTPSDFDDQFVSLYDVQGDAAGKGFSSLYGSEAQPGGDSSPSEQPGSASSHDKEHDTGLPSGDEYGPFLDRLIGEMIARVEADLCEADTGGAAGGQEQALLSETVIFCPFPPVTEIMTETPGADLQMQMLGQANVYTTSQNGHSVSLVGPAHGRAESSSTLEWMIDNGAEHIIILGLCERMDEAMKEACLVVAEPAAGQGSSRRVPMAMAEAINGRNKDHRLLQLYITDKGECLGTGNLAEAAGAEMSDVFSIAARRKVDVACLMVASGEIESIRQSLALPSTHFFTDVWNACYLALDAAFKVAGNA